MAGVIRSYRPSVDPGGRGPTELMPLAWRLRRVLLQEPVDVVLAHGGWPAEVTALAAPRRGPLIVWQRTLGVSDKLWNPVWRRWWATVARRFDAAVALTDDQEVELRRLGFRGPVWVIPNFRRPDRFRDVNREVAGAGCAHRSVSPSGHR
jgi:Glycosyltransferase Family 4